MADQHPTPPSPDVPDAPTALTVYTDRLARGLSYSDKSAMPINRIVARIIVRDIFKRAVHLPQVGWTVDRISRERPKDLLLLARRMRAAARLSDDPATQTSFALGAFQRSETRIPLSPKEHKR